MKTLQLFFVIIITLSIFSCQNRDEIASRHGENSSNGILKTTNTGTIGTLLSILETDYSGLLDINATSINGNVRALTAMYRHYDSNNNPIAVGSVLINSQPLILNESSMSYESDESIEIIPGSHVDYAILGTNHDTMLSGQTYLPLAANTIFPDSLVKGSSISWTSDPNYSGETLVHATTGFNSMGLQETDENVLYSVSNDADESVEITTDFLGLVEYGNDEYAFVHLVRGELSLFDVAGSPIQIRSYNLSTTLIKL